MENLLNQIESLGWYVTQQSGTTYGLNRLSSAGQDFWINVECEDGSINTFLKNLYQVYEDFDISYETYLWLDEFGHGRRGAPYDMRDLYNDMEECCESISKLYDVLYAWWEENEEDNE